MASAVFEEVDADDVTDWIDLQAVLDLAVQEFLDRMRSVEGFAETLETAEREQQRRAGIRHVRPPPGTDE